MYGIGPTRSDHKWVSLKLEGLKIELELSASDANVSILSCDSRQPITANLPAGCGVFKHVRFSDSTNGMKERNKINI